LNKIKDSDFDHVHKIYFDHMTWYRGLIVDLDRRIKDLELDIAEWNQKVPELMPYNQYCVRHPGYSDTEEHLLQLQKALQTTKHIRSEAAGKFPMEWA
jgi:hypothetical protein